MQMLAQTAQSFVVIVVFYLVGFQVEIVVAVFANVFQCVSGKPLKK